VSAVNLFVLMLISLSLHHFLLVCFDAYCICAVFFQVANLSSIAIITISLLSNSIISRPGTSVSPIAPSTFLYGTIYHSYKRLQKRIKNML
jgi:hypothetical protein